MSTNADMPLLALCGCQIGVIESGFGKTGKFRTMFANGLRGAQPGDKLYLR